MPRKTNAELMAENKKLKAALKNSERLVEAHMRLNEEANDAVQKLWKETVYGDAHFAPGTTHWLQPIKAAAEMIDRYKLREANDKADNERLESEWSEAKRELSNAWVRRDDALRDNRLLVEIIKEAMKS